MVETNHKLYGYGEMSDGDSGYSTRPSSSIYTSNTRPSSSIFEPSTPRSSVSLRRTSSAQSKILKLRNKSRKNSLQPDVENISVNRSLSINSELPPYPAQDDNLESAKEITSRTASPTRNKRLSKSAVSRVRWKSSTPPLYKNNHKPNSSPTENRRECTEKSSQSQPSAPAPSRSSSLSSLSSAERQWQVDMKLASDQIHDKTTTDESGNMDSAHMMDFKVKLEPTDNTTIENTEAKLIDRSSSRTLRERPWRISSATTPRSSISEGHREIHYEKTLPPSRWTECKPKKYVTNHKYGTHFEVRTKKPSTRVPKPGMSFLWKNNCQVWLMERLGEVDFNTKQQLNQQRQEREEKLERERERGNRPKTAPITSRELKEGRKIWRRKIYEAEDKSNVFDQFVEWSMANQKRRHSAVIFQKFYRGWKVRAHIQNLKIRCVRNHGSTWNKFTTEYKLLLERVQLRCGIHKPSTPFNLDELDRFMDKKEAYEKVFHTMSVNDELPRSNLMQYFRQCSLFPLEREVDMAFNSVFRGCGVQADVIFLLDCSASIGRPLYEMQLQLIIDLVNHCDVSYDKIQIAVIPYNDDVFRVIDFHSYGSKEELTDELAELTYDVVQKFGQITRTDLALKCMIELVKDVSEKSDHIRDGSRVPKICIAFTDGKCYHTQLTEKWAETARNKLCVEMHLVNCTRTEPSARQFLDITNTEDRIYSLTDYHTLRNIKTAVQTLPCLKSCPLCQFKKNQGDSNESCLCGDETRGLYVHEVLELIWTIYCPPATGLKKYKDSLWMSPKIEGQGSMKLTRYHASGTNFRDCLKKAVKDRISEYGKVILPTETGVRVREIDEVDLAMDFIDKLCVSKLHLLGLVEEAGNTPHMAQYKYKH